MTPAEAKKELKAYRDNLKRIASRASRVRELQSEMAKIKTPTYGEIKGNNHYRLEELIDKINQLQLEHAEAIWEYERLNMVIRAKLEQLQSPYLDILSDIYLLGKTYEQVAANRHYTCASVKVIAYRGIRKYADLTA
jgi:DNA-directed RNA polymerase specialized sigma24 family protein